MTASAPASPTASTLADPRAAPMTRAPRARSSWTSRMPIPPAAPRTRTCSPGRTSTSRAMRRAVGPSWMIAAASSGSRPSGTGTVSSRLTAARSADSPPPPRPPVWAITGRPSQPSSTPSPTEITSPATPPPGTYGGRIGKRPTPRPDRIMVSTNSTSLALAATTTSPGPATGSGAEAGTSISGPPNRPTEMTSTGSADVRLGAGGRDMTRLEAGLVRIDVVGEDPPRVDADDLGRQVAVGRGLADDRLGGAADLQEVRALHALLGHLVDDEGDAGIGLDVAVLGAGAHVEAGDVDRPQAGVVGEAEGFHLGRPVGADGRQVTSGLGGEETLLGVGEAHAPTLRPQVLFRSSSCQGRGSRAGRARRRRGGRAQRRGRFRAALLRGPGPDLEPADRGQSAPVPARGASPGGVHPRLAGRRDPAEPDQGRARPAARPPDPHPPGLGAPVGGLAERARRPDRPTSAPARQPERVHRLRVPVARPVQAHEPG